MLLPIHIIIALSSLVVTGVSYVTPSKAKLSGAYTLVALTLATGTALVISMPAHLVSACFSGLIYLAFVSVGIVSARHKLARSVTVN
jgi:hypothetical protein